MTTQMRSGQLLCLAGTMLTIKSSRTQDFIFIIREVDPLYQGCSAAARTGLPMSRNQCLGLMGVLGEDWLGTDGGSLT